MEGKTSMRRVVDTRMLMLPILNHVRVKLDLQKKETATAPRQWDTIFSGPEDLGTRDQGPEDLRTWGPGTRGPEDLGPGTQIGMHCIVASSLGEYPGPHAFHAWVCVSNHSTGM